MKMLTRYYFTPMPTSNAKSEAQTHKYSLRIQCGSYVYVYHVWFIDRKCCTKTCRYAIDDDDDDTQHPPLLYDKHIIKQMCTERTLSSINKFIYQSICRMFYIYREQSLCSASFCQFVKCTEPCMLHTHTLPLSIDLRLIHCEYMYVSGWCAVASLQFSQKLMEHHW